MVGPFQEEPKRRVLARTCARKCTIRAKVPVLYSRLYLYTSMQRKMAAQVQTRVAESAFFFFFFPSVASRAYDDVGVCLDGAGEGTWEELWHVLIQKALGRGLSTPGRPAKCQPVFFFFPLNGGEK